MKELNVIANKIYFFLAPDSQASSKTHGKFTLTSAERKKIIELSFEFWQGGSVEVVEVPEGAVTKEFFHGFVA